MKKKSSNRRAKDEMRQEYQFDYSRARPNRFASRMTHDAVTIVLEPDVADFFETSESVNRLLRSVIAAVPKMGSRAAKDKRRSAR